MKKLSLFVLAIFCLAAFSCTKEQTLKMHLENHTWKMVLSGASAGSIYLFNSSGKGEAGGGSFTWTNTDNAVTITDGNGEDKYTVTSEGEKSQTWTQDNGFLGVWTYKLTRLK